MVDASIEDHVGASTSTPTATLTPALALAEAGAFTSATAPASVCHPAPPEEEDGRGGLPPEPSRQVTVFQAERGCAANNASLLARLPAIVRA